MILPDISSTPFLRGVIPAVKDQVAVADSGLVISALGNGILAHTQYLSIIL